MAELETRLRELAAKGQLNHLSVIAHHDRAGKQTFRASFRDTKHDGKGIGEDADPVAALLKVLK